VDDVAIKVDGVYKTFKLPHERAGSFKNIFTHVFSFARKKRVYDTQHALSNVTFEIKKGEFFGIVGRNGSGKSTLLKMLAGIYQPNKGSITVNGRLVPFIELGVGFNAELTGRENVYLNGALIGFNKAEIDAMYQEIVDFAELEKFMDQKLKNYSSGMQVRLAFSLAIRADADILLVDEVLAVGDADFQRKCFDYFRTLKRNKKTVVFVSHDMNAIREYCDNAIMIEKSEIVASGKPEKIATKYAKLFMDQARSQTEDEAGVSSRWGTGAVKFTDIKVAVSEELITIDLKAVANETVENSNFGFSVKDATGQTLLGINSQIKRKKIDTLTAGTKVDLTWQFPNVLKDGDYFVDLAVIDKDGEVWDWWEEAKVFRVLKEERTPYPISPAVDLKLTVRP